MSRQEFELISTLAEENARLKAVADLMRVLADPGLHLSDKLEACLEGLAGLVKAEQASIMLVEGERLVVAAATNPDLIGMVTPLGEPTISTQVVCSGEAVCLPDLQQSALAAAGRHGDRSSYRTRSLISLPLMEGRVAVGVLNLADKADAERFDGADLELALAMAGEVSRLIHFSALHSRLQRAHQELKEVQRDREDLMHMVFHDLKAPLTAAREALGLLRGGGELSPAQREEFLALAEGDLELLWRRITNLLDLQRMDQGRLPLQPAPLRLGELIEEARVRLLPVARVRGVEVEVEAAPGMEVVADEDLVERVLVNLLFNALKFSSPEEGGGGWVRVRLGPRDGQALVEVIDSGPGVAPALAGQVFERYALIRPSRGSTGLGLYFCRRAAQMLGGEVAWRNLPQGGACFSLALPLTPAP